ncbi:SH3 domain-containing protein [Siminovitchia sp. 179-K 8D1 HS]|uniref:SH3 domain-containing protein n=1 Tax=Siminovitchia sp. 179-K 8D1 HS TaxID=3142385 RepID=UPI0039A2E780
MILAAKANTAHAESNLSGIAIQSPTHVYKSTIRTSNILKSYPAGSILKYQSYNGNWYSAVVYINGKKNAGYIHKSDVETAVSNHASLRGIALGNQTHVYPTASTSSKPLKSYNAGSVLTYRTFTSDWYQATVYIGGKPKTGYIQKKQVENAVGNQEALNGIAQKNPTAVYKNASTNAAWKTYPAGSILKYKTFSTNWYEATVYVNGKRQNGYINKSHVENANQKQISLRGVGLKSPTAVYSKASTSSSKLKSYSLGTVLKYQTFSNNWYQAKVYIKGKATIGYIHKNDVDELVANPKSLQGRALKSPTKVYSNVSAQSAALKSYPKHSNLKFKTFSANWYEATVYVNGKQSTGYIHVNDVTTKDIFITTKYNYSFKHMTDVQMYPGRAKSDGAGLINATREEVEYYANPANFSRGTTEYYQFLVLSEPVGLNAKEVNEKILKGKGNLEGQAQAFIEAGKKYKINEAYLIAHALHETGNGRSTLANGIPVDKNGKVTRDENGNIAKTAETAHTVYNMYGYGANDTCPIDCGAKYAFDQGWFSQSASIIGGASSIYTYISRGQDTLYKMKWNPVSPGHPQYATHVQWAVLQTGRIAAIYDTLDHFTLVFDVPAFIDQPGPTKKPATRLLNRSLLRDSHSIETFDFNNDKMVTESPNHKDVPSSEDGTKIGIEEKSGEPSNTEEPADIEVPAGDDEPADVEVPAGDDEPSDVEVPADDDEPSDVEVPAEAEEPADVEVPADTEGSPNAEEPADDEETSDTEGPSDDKEPSIDEELSSNLENQVPDKVYGVIKTAEDINVSLKSSPDTKDGNIIVLTIPSNTILEILEASDSWYKVNYDEQEGWVNGEYVELLNLLELTSKHLYAHETPNGQILGKISDRLIAAVLDKDHKIVRQDEWLQVYWKDQKVWVNGGKDGAEFIDVK